MIEMGHEVGVLRGAVKPLDRRQPYATRSARPVARVGPSAARLGIDTSLSCRRHTAPHNENRHPRRTRKAPSFCGA